MTPLLLAAALTFAQAPAPTTPLTPASAATDPAPQQAHLLRRAKILGFTGASALIVSAGFWSFTIAAMLGGNHNANRYNALVADVNSTPRPPDDDERRQLDDISRNGQTDNRLAIGGGVTAGVLTVIGVSLLVRARILRARARDISPLVLPRGLGLGWRLHF